MSTVWDVVRDRRSAAMRDADIEIESTMPDEQNAIERMRQEIIALVDLWMAERARDHNAPEESCPACQASWRRMGKVTRAHRHISPGQLAWEWLTMALTA